MTDHDFMYEVIQRLARIEENLKPIIETQQKHCTKIEWIEKLVWRITGGATVVLAIASYLLKS
jgi:hypothetical protein